MGLAERFKDKLSKSNIFQKESKNIQYISTPIEHKEIKNILSEPVRYELEDLESLIIDKIRKTPYWSEYSVTRQRQMISSYFDKKSKIQNNLQKSEFVQNILDLVSGK